MGQKGTLQQNGAKDKTSTGQPAALGMKSVVKTSDCLHPIWMIQVLMLYRFICK